MHSSQEQIEPEPPRTRRIFKWLNLILLGVSLFLAVAYLSRTREENNRSREMMRRLEPACDRKSDARPEDESVVVGADPTVTVNGFEETRHFDATEVAEIAEILESSRCRAMSCAGFAYRLYPVDINKDGDLEYVVERTECGSGGCQTALFMRQEGRWVNLVEVFGAVFVEETETNGFRDLTSSYKDYPERGRCEVKRVHLTWNGSSHYEPSHGVRILHRAGPDGVPPEMSHSTEARGSYQAPEPDPLLSLTRGRDKYCYDFPLIAFSSPRQNSPEAYCQRGNTLSIKRSAVS